MRLEKPFYSFAVLALVFALLSACSSDENTTPVDDATPDIVKPGAGTDNIKTIAGSVWYRERMLLPPGAEVHVFLEDVAKMDVAAEVIADTSFVPQGGPPWNFELDYDPEKLSERGRYALRCRIEVEGRLVFINTQMIPAFGEDTGTPVEILVSAVGKG